MFAFSFAASLGCAKTLPSGFRARAASPTSRCPAVPPRMGPETVSGNGGFYAGQAQLNAKSSTQFFGGKFGANDRGAARVSL